MTKQKKLDLALMKMVDALCAVVEEVPMPDEHTRKQVRAIEKKACQEALNAFEDWQKTPDTTLSTGVELGSWGLPSLPAGHPDGLPPLNLTVEELTALMSTEEAKKELNDAISKIVCIGPLHLPRR